MKYSEQLQTALTRAISQLLEPLCRLLLRHNVSFDAFVEIAKRSYVSVAMNDFAIPGKKTSISRASILTGLTRKEVQRLVTLSDDKDSTKAEPVNRATRVLTGWVRDSDYRDSAGNPLPLSVQDGTNSFADLVRKYSGDMPVRAVLDELLRVGAITLRADHRIDLATRAYVPQASEIEKLKIFGSDTADLISTIDHNLQHGVTAPRYQRKVLYTTIPASVVPEFQRESAARAQALLEHLDRWLSTKDIKTPDNEPDIERVRLGLGIYHIESTNPSTTPKENRHDQSI
jgi:Family of unknown function (DUF6502)